VIRDALIALGAGALLFVSIPTHALAQQPPYAAPRTLDGKPDIGRVWSNLGVKATLQQTIDGEVRTSPSDNSVEERLPFSDSASALAWRRK